MHGVEPICVALQFAPLTSYHRKRRERDPSPRAVRDAELWEAIGRVHDDAFGGVYGYRKVHRQLRRQGVDIGRDATLRLMRLMGPRGATRGRGWKTTTRQGRRANWVAWWFEPDGRGAHGAVAAQLTDMAVHSL